MSKLPRLPRHGHRYNDTSASHWAEFSQQCPIHSQIVTKFQTTPRRICFPKDTFRSPGVAARPGGLLPTLCTSSFLSLRPRYCFGSMVKPDCDHGSGNLKAPLSSVRSRCSSRSTPSYAFLPSPRKYLLHATMSLYSTNLFGPLYLLTVSYSVDDFCQPRLSMIHCEPSVTIVSSTMKRDPGHPGP